MQSYRRWGKQRTSPPFFYRGSSSRHFCGNDAQQARKGTCQTTAKESLLHALPFQFPGCQNCSQLPGGMWSSFKEGQFRIPLPPVKPGDQEQERWHHKERLGTQNLSGAQHSSFQTKDRVLRKLKAFPALCRFPTSFFSTLPLAVLRYVVKQISSFFAGKNTPFLGHIPYLWEISANDHQKKRKYRNQNWEAQSPQQHCFFHEQRITRPLLSPEDIVRIFTHMEISAGIPIRLVLVIASLLVKTLHTKYSVSLKTFGESLSEAFEHDT